MTETLTEDQLSWVSDFVANAMGLYFPRERWKDLERHVKSAARELGYAETNDFLEWMSSTPLNQGQVETLASFLTVSETYFWREPRVFEALRDKILPELISNREYNGRRLRLWSAGCATGEEVYSLAIALREALPQYKKWHITLLATDINPNILRKAAAGVYGEWSFRNSPQGFKDKYFRRMENGKYEILAEIRNMVTFSYFNLAVDEFPSTMNNTNAMDVIFCRNVLMYFSRARASLIGNRLYDCLVEGGWFMVSANELSLDTFAQFTSCQFPEAIVYRKLSGKSVPVKKEPLRVSADVLAPAVKPAFTSGKKVPPAAVPNFPARTKKQEEATIWVAQPSEDVQPVDSAQAVRALANQGKLTEALTACETAIAADKLDPGMRYLYAVILQEQDRIVEAIASLESTLYLEPDFLIAHFAMGNLKNREGKTTAAVRCYQNALKLLDKYQPDDILPQAEGLTAGRFREIVIANLKIDGIML